MIVLASQFDMRRISILETNLDRLFLFLWGPDITIRVSKNARTRLMVNYLTSTVSQDILVSRYDGWINMRS